MQKSNHIFYFLTGLEQIEFFVRDIHTESIEFESNELEDRLNAFRSQKTRSINSFSYLFPLIVYLKNSSYKFYKKPMEDSIIPRFIEVAFYNTIPSSSNLEKAYVQYLDDDDFGIKTIHYNVSFLMQSLGKIQWIEIASKGDLLTKKSTYDLPKLSENLVHRLFYLMI